VKSTVKMVFLVVRVKKRRSKASHTV